MTAESVFERELIGRIRAGLDLDESFLPWLEALAAVPVTTPARLPAGAELGPIADRLAVPDYAVAELPAAIRAAESDEAIRFLLDHAVAALDAARGSLTRLTPGWPMLPDRLGVVARYFHLLVFLATVPAMRRYHAERAIPDEVSWATLADAGRHVRVFRQIYGVGGLEHPGWFQLHELGLLYDLGRLQFNRAQIGTGWDVDGAPFGVGDYVLGVHIPQSGPLRPESCADSFRRAGPFFRRYFSEEPYRYAMCRSWLLDDQLAEYLPADSNIVRFQRMFTPLGPAHEGDRDIVDFVFRTTNHDVDRLPQRTTLERAVVTHLRAGRHWRVAAGYVEL